MEISALRDIAYQYYPQNVSPFSDEFEQTPETLERKRYTLFQREKLAGSWKELMDDLQLVYEPIMETFEDITPAVQDCPVLYSTLVIYPAKDVEDPIQRSYGKAHVWISLLIPYCRIEFTFYQSGSLSTEQQYLLKGKIENELLILVKKHLQVEAFPEHLRKEVLPHVETMHSNGTALFEEIFFTDYTANY